MQKTYLHRECSSMSRKFFEDFDLLPSEVKRLIDFGPTCPNFDDLKEAWKLAGEMFSIDLLNSRLHSFEEERKAEAKRVADNERRRAREERQRERDKRKYGLYQQTTMVTRTRDDKHARLVKRVTEEEAARLLTQRKNNKDVVSGAKIYVTQEFVQYHKKPVEAPVEKEKKVYQQSAPKQWGNA